MTRVLFAGGGTGGHLYPALALANAVRDQRRDAEVHFVGAHRGVEARVLPQLGLPHTLLPIEPLYRDRIWQNVRQFSAMTRTLLGLHGLFKRFAPSLVVGTGGYASGPAGAWAVLRGVPLALQEQNSYPGATTRFLSRYARQVHLGFPEAARHLRPGRATKIHVLGNPIRPPDVIDRLDARSRFGLSGQGTVALVVGGSQGARAINEALGGAIERVARGELPAPPTDFQLLWATGPTHVDNVREQLAPLGVDAWVRIVGYIEDMPYALAAANVAISRAGAMGTAELLAWGVPTILIPLPTAAANHQVHNARAIAEAGAGVFLEERDATPQRLWRELHALAADEARRTEMAARARERARPNAAREIAAQLLTLVEAA